MKAAEMDYVSPLYVSIAPPDELSMCSEEVRKLFEGKGGYFTGTPTMMQLSLDIRKLVDAVNRLEETLRRQRG